jgi:hypothetical protein
MHCSLCFCVLGSKWGLRRRFLVAPYGALQWVLNIHAAGSTTLTRGRGSEAISVTELEAEEAAPILNQYLSSVLGAHSR